VAQKKALSLPESIRLGWIKQEKKYSIRRQCDLAGIPRSTFYYEPVPESTSNLRIMRAIDERYMQHPEYGSPRMHDWLQDNGYIVNHKRVARLMQKMGLQAITPGPHTSKPCTGHKIYPYLLRGVAIEHVNQVWSIDITYVPMNKGYMYLVAVIDWYSRYVLSWELSNSMDTDFCVRALQKALCCGIPEIFNTDQGSQFTSSTFTQELIEKDIAISMDGRGRALDNVFIERLWWTVKYENIYPKDYGNGHALYNGLLKYLNYYNNERKHSSLDNRTPHEVLMDVLK